MIVSVSDSSAKKIQSAKFNPGSTTANNNQSLYSMIY
jgi:hypothetical protein